jgi:hypothetical protein
VWGGNTCAAIAGGSVGAGCVSGWVGADAVGEGVVDVGNASVDCDAIVAAGVVVSIVEVPHAASDIDNTITRVNQSDIRTTD